MSFATVGSPSLRQVPAMSSSLAAATAAAASRDSAKPTSCAGYSADLTWCAASSPHHRPPAFWKTAQARMALAWVSDQRRRRRACAMPQQAIHAWVMGPGSAGLARQRRTGEDRGGSGARGATLVAGTRRGRPSDRECIAEALDACQRAHVAAGPAARTTPARTDVRFRPGRGFECRAFEWLRCPFQRLHSLVRRATSIAVSACSRRPGGSGAHLTRQMVRPGRHPRVARPQRQSRRRQHQHHPDQVGPVRVLAEQRHSQHHRDHR
jgi:hypothetical protein